MRFLMFVFFSFGAYCNVVYATDKLDAIKNNSQL